jgi:hypothetical protein
MDDDAYDRYLTAFDTFTAGIQAALEVSANANPNLETHSRFRRAALEGDGVPLFPSMLKPQ